MNKFLAFFLIAVLMMNIAAAGEATVESGVASHYLNVGFGTFVSNVNVADDDDGYYTSSGGFGGFMGVGFVKPNGKIWEINTMVAHFNLDDGDEPDDPDTTFGVLVGPAKVWKANFNNGFSLFGRLGIALGAGSVTYHDDTSSSAALVLPYDGVGVGYQINDDFGVSLEYNGLLFGIANVGLMSMDVNYYF